MQISKKQWTEIEALLDRTVAQRDDARRETETVKCILEDSTKEIEKQKEILKDMESTIVAKDKYISQLSAGKTAAEVTLREAVEIMNKLSKKLGVKKPLTTTEYDTALVEDLLHKFDVMV